VVARFAAQNKLTKKKRAKKIEVFVQAPIESF
jgi:hypothetical protein